MMKRRDFVQTATTAEAAFTVGATNTGAATPLPWKHLHAGERGFLRAPVLPYDSKETIRIDGGFSLPDGHAVVEAVNGLGKTLTTVYISQSDPDFYFSLGPVKAAFPATKFIAASATIAAIKANAEKKLAVWGGGRLKENGPRSLADIVMPEDFDGTVLHLEGHPIEIVPAQGMENRRYLWVPALKAVFGGDMVFSGLHCGRRTPHPRSLARPGSRTWRLSPRTSRQSWCPNICSSPRHWTSPP